MAIKKKKYLKAKITSKKVRLSFFLSKTSWVDQFSFVGQVYAQSDGGNGTSYSLGSDNGNGPGDSGQ